MGFPICANEYAVGQPETDKRLPKKLPIQRFGDRNLGYECPKVYRIYEKSYILKWRAAGSFCVLPKKEAWNVE